MATYRLDVVYAAAEEKRGSVYETSEELSLYRKVTEGVLQRYIRCSVELGRLPAPLGKGLGFLRAKASSYKLSSFEDTMVFVVDVERCIKRLDQFEQVLIQRIALQAYTWEETARLLRCAQSTVDERYPMTLDKLTAMFLGNGMLKAKR
jgi:hypothetical protein